MGIIEIILNCSKGEFNIMLFVFIGAAQPVGVGFYALHM